VSAVKVNITDFVYLFDADNLAGLVLVFDADNLVGLVLAFDADNLGLGGHDLVFDADNLAGLVLVFGVWLTLPLQASSHRTEYLAYGWKSGR
jgi:hypothetical protein